MPGAVCQGYAESAITIQLRCPKRGSSCCSLVSHGSMADALAANAIANKAANETSVRFIDGSTVGVGRLDLEGLANTSLDGHGERLARVDRQRPIELKNNS